MFSSTTKRYYKNKGKTTMTENTKEHLKDVLISLIPIVFIILYILEAIGVI
jgi:hypothetical protein